MTPTLPVADAWFRVEQVTDQITRIDEPHVDELLRANIWHVRGIDRDLVVDAGLGVASLRDHVPALFENNPILVISHAHLDHVGSAAEFDERWMHSAASVDSAMPATLNGPELGALLGLDGSQLPDLLITSVPTGFDPAAYSIETAQATKTLADGDEIHLGDRVLTVLHLPGHTPDSICLYDEANRLLFSGDVLYDDVLLDELHESNIDEYIDSMRRLRALPVLTVYPGHGDPLDGERMRALIDQYLGERSAHS